MWSTKVKKWGGFGARGGPSEKQRQQRADYLLSLLLYLAAKVRFGLVKKAGSCAAGRLFDGCRLLQTVGLEEAGGTTGTA